MKTAVADLPVKPSGRIPPAEERTYQVLCDSCEGWAQTVFYAGSIGLAAVSAPYAMALKSMMKHARRYPGHKTHLLKHTQNELLKTRIAIDCEEDGA